MKQLTFQAKDLFHHAAKNALINDGWTITDDPFLLRWGRKDSYVDLGAEKFFGAEKGDKKIAVEVKSFVGHSELNDLKQALGQYVLYLALLSEVEPDRMLYLAVRQETWTEVFEEPVGQLLLRFHNLNVIVFDDEKEEITRWIP